VFYHHRPDPETPLEETMGALAQAVRSGKALYIALSNYTPEHTRAAALILRDLGTPLLIHQLPYSMLRRENVENGLLDALDTLAHEHGRSLAQLALACVLRDSRMTSAIIGASSVAQLEDNVAALDKPALTPEALARIDQILEG
jgi:L-glyceraldehyde 3-phosphate reductase